MKTAYELTMKLIQVMSELENTINRKSKASKHDQEWLDKHIDRLELEMFTIKKQLKGIEIY